MSAASSPARLWLVAALMAGSVAAAGSSTLTPEPERGGSLHNLSMAYNLWKYGVVSTSRSDEANPEPGWRREPLYPMTLAGALALSADPATIDQDCLVHAAPSCHAVLLTLKRVNAVFFGLLCAATFGLGCMVLRRPWPAAGAATVVALSGAWWRILDRLKTEPLAALLLVLACMGLHGLALRPQRGRWAWLAGVSLGLLILTKAVFLYVAPALLLGAALAWRRPGDRVARHVLLATGIAYAVAGIWIARNVAHGAGFIIAEDRAVLAIRAEHDTMSWREIAAAWLYFPGERNALARRLMEAWFEPEDWALLEEDNPHGYYERAKNKTGAVAARTGVANPTARQMDRAARAVVLDHAARHVVLTGPFALRSSFVAWPIFAWPPLWWVMYVTVNLSVPALLALFLWRLLRGPPDGAWFLVLPVASFALHAFATHAIPRYTWPAVPIGLVALALLITVAPGRALARRRA